MQANLLQKRKTMSKSCPTFTGSYTWGTLVPTLQFMVTNTKDRKGITKDERKRGKTLDNVLGLNTGRA